MEIKIKRDGLWLRGQIDRPQEGNQTQERNQPVAILFHGFGGDLDYGEGLYTKLVSRLNRAGIAVVRFDFNGHGKSDGDFGNMNILNEIEDAIAILEYVRTLAFVKEIYVIGHSQGGVVGGMLAGYYPDVIKRLVLLAPAATLKEDAQKGICMGSSYDTLHVPEYVSVDGGKHLVGGHYFRIARSLPIYEVTAQYGNPALAIHGAEDSLVDKKASIHYGEVLRNCEVKIYENLDHGIEGADQEKALCKITEFLAEAL